MPAQAGEPCARRARWGRRRVYPRAGGGTFDRMIEYVRAAGLSPRRRGNHVYRVGDEDPVGSIPAQAREPSRGFGRE